MSDRKYSNFIPKWARDGRWEMGEFPTIGFSPIEDSSEESQVAEKIPAEIAAEYDAMAASLKEAIRKSDERYEAEISRIRGAVCQFIDEARADLEQEERELRRFYRNWCICMALVMAGLVVVAVAVTP